MLTLRLSSGGGCRDGVAELTERCSEEWESESADLCGRGGFLIMSALTDLDSIKFEDGGFRSDCGVPTLENLEDDDGVVCCGR